MEFNIRTEELQFAVSKIFSIVDKKSNRPILHNFMVEAKGENLIVSANDLEVAAKIKVKSATIQEGRICVNAKNFFEILKSLPNDDVHIELNKEQNILYIRCNRINFTLVTCPPDDFPEFNLIPQSETFTLNARDLRSVIIKNWHAVSNDETRPFLGGIFFKFESSQLSTVSTDGHRLALYRQNISDVSSQVLEEGIIVPKKGLNELKKLTETYPEDDIQFSINESFAYVNLRNSYMISIRLVAREFPQYGAVISNDASSFLKIDRQTFLSAIKRVKILANERSHGVRLSVSDNSVILEASRPTSGGASEKISAYYQGPPAVIALNATYLIDALSVMDSPQAVLKFNNNLGPIMLKSSNDDRFHSIIMPLKI